jgi:biopolymer transport protein ExbD
MKFQSRTAAPYLAAFNFSSLTDIVMLLLIFFLLTSSFVTTRGLDVVLPQAANADTEEDARLYLSVDDKGGIMLNDRATSLTELPALVRAALGRDSTQVVVIRADQTLELGGIVEILDAVKGAGARRFFIATEAPEE